MKSSMQIFSGIIGNEKVREEEKKITSILDRKVLTPSRERQSTASACERELQRIKKKKKLEKKV